MIILYKMQNILVLSQKIRIICENSSNLQTIYKTALFIKLFEKGNLTYQTDPQIILFRSQF